MDKTLIVKGMPINIDPMDSLLSTEEAKKLLNVSLRTLRRWIDAGKLPAYEFESGVLRFKRSELLALLSLKQVKK